MSKTNRAIINTDTGEQEYILQEGDRIVTKKQDDYVSSHQMNFNQDKPFVKLYTDVVPILRKYLTYGEISFLFGLSEFISYEDGLIRKCGHGNCNVVNINDLAELLDMSYDSTRKMINKLCNKGVLCLIKTGYINPDIREKYTTAYAVNPYIFFRGINANKRVLESFFNNSGWKEAINKYYEI